MVIESLSKATSLGAITRTSSFQSTIPASTVSMKQGSCGLRLCLAPLGYKVKIMETGQTAHPWRMYYVDFIIKNAVLMSLHSDFSRTPETAGSRVPFNCTSYLHHVFLCHGDVQLDCLCSCVFSKK